MQLISQYSRIRMVQGPTLRISKEANSPQRPALHLVPFPTSLQGLLSLSQTHTLPLKSFYNLQPSPLPVLP